MNYLGVMLLTWMLVLTGCQDSQIKENRRLAAEVMEIHDLAMAKMGQMHELKLKLQEQGSAGAGGEAVEEAIAALETAHRGMMVWMRQYREPASDEELRDGRAYLEDQRQKISTVSQDIEASIARAQSLLN